MRIPDITPTLNMCPEMCLHMPEQGLLVISDVHMGRVQHMRRNGLAIPTAAAQKDLNNLIQVISAYQPQCCLFLGDLFHSLPNSEWPQLFQALESFPHTQFLLITGNHDRFVTHHLPPNWEQHSEWEIDGIRFCHEPSEQAGFEICGHLHPSYSLRGKGRQSLRLPCFWLSDQRLVMPAFSSLAGGYSITPEPGQRIFISNGKIVSEVKIP
ncbi:MAG: ligase-associated DNA damage response endonuclease PdeM [Bacteroidetes bacterium]|nr:ligase-associated DNA damage response endonuclease PdeM [Bacteroidota bacterium]MDA0942961.1 ligase-associated DNA damage response endonuclease PdeM [Bacteroidota bacterium]MDA1111667.1 ligase-associated DNA damage response endonuclease PdeM [Bacteroidota bacterium]